MGKEIPRIDGGSGRELAIETVAKIRNYAAKNFSTRCDRKLGIFTARFWRPVISIAPSSAQRQKYLLFTLIGAILAYVLVHNEAFLVNMGHPAWKHYASFKWLLPHGIAGAYALFLGPMQFSDRLRQRHLQLHRVLGRIYVAGAFIAGPLGIYIQFFQERFGSPRSFSMAAVTHSTDSQYLVDADDRGRLQLRSEREDPTAPPVDGAQFCGGPAGISQRTCDPRDHRAGATGPGYGRDGRVGLPRFCYSARRYRTLLAGSLECANSRSQDPHGRDVARLFRSIRLGSFSKVPR